MFPLSNYIPSYDKNLSARNVSTLLDSIVDDVYLLAVGGESSCQQSDFARKIDQIKRCFRPGFSSPSVSTVVKIVHSISLLKIKDSELNQHIINVLICNMQLFSQVNLQDFIVLARFAHKENSLLFKGLMRTRGLIDIQFLAADFLKCVKDPCNKLDLNPAITAIRNYLASGFPIDGNSLVNITSALKYLSLKDEELNTILSKAAISCIYAFDPRSLADFTNLFARLSPKCRNSVPEIISAAGYPNIKNLVLNFVSDSPKLSDKIVQYIESDFPVSGALLADLACYCQFDQDIMSKSIAKSCVRNIDLFTIEELSTIAQVFSTLEIPNKVLLFGAIAKVAIDKIHEFTSRRLNALALHFAEAKMQCPELFQRISNIAKRNLDSCHRMDLAMLPLVFKRVQIEDRDLFNCVAKVAVERIHEFTQSDFAKLKRALPSSEYPKLHEAINSVDLYAKLCVEHGASNICKDHYFPEMDGQVDYYIPSKNLIICKGPQIMDPSTTEMPLWGKQQELLHFADGLGLQVEFVSV